jgi:hypothetical protein
MSSRSSKGTAAFFALLILHVCLALSFKSAQHGPAAEYGFSPALVLVLAEAIKLFISLGILCREVFLKHSVPSSEHDEPGKRILTDQFWHGSFLLFQELKSKVSISLAWRTAVLATFYCVNNNLTFALFRIADGANIALIKSGSSVASAILLRFGLGRAISSTQWSAIWLQAFGLVVTQFGTTCSNTPLLRWYTYCLLLVSLLISSFCGVWNDQMLKVASRHGTSMHVVNILLYGYGFFLNAGTHIMTTASCYDDLGGQKSGCLQSLFSLAGFDDSHTYLVLACQSFFGLAISSVYKYADAAVKTFALSCATSILMAINVIAFGAPFNVVVLMGCLTVFAATHLYVVNPPSSFFPGRGAAAKIFQEAEDEHERSLK